LSDTLYLLIQCSLWSNETICIVCIFCTVVLYVGCLSFCVRRHTMIEPLPEFPPLPPHHRPPPPAPVTPAAPPPPAVDCRILVLNGKQRSLLLCCFIAAETIQSRQGDNLVKHTCSWIAELVETVKYQSYDEIITVNIIHVVIKQNNTNTRCARRWYTSTNANHFTKMSAKSDPVFESGFLYWSRSGCPADCSQTVVDLLPCRHQSAKFCQNQQEMRNANKSPKILYSTVVKKMEKWCGIRVRSTTKS